MANDTERKALSFRLSAKALQLLDAMAAEQGITRTAVLELIIRKAAEDAEERMPSVYDLLH